LASADAAADGFVLNFEGKNGARVRHLFSCAKDNKDVIGIQSFRQEDNLAIIEWHPSALGCGYEVASDRSY
jgi:hypothetical protein